MGIHNFGPSLQNMLKPDVEFVTNVTSDKIGFGYIFQELPRKTTLSVKFAEFRLEFSQSNWSEFVFEQIIAQN